MPTSPRSPRPSKKENKTQYLDFFDALRTLLSGKKITKKEWNDPTCYLVMADDRLKIFKPQENKLFELIVSGGDMIGMDWYVLE